jgi:hypothetical protein
VKWQNEGVAQARKDLDFAIEPLSTECSALLGTQYLERNGTLEAFVPGEVDCCHSSLAELALESVVAGKSVAKFRRNAGIGHRFQIFASR